MESSHLLTLLGTEAMNSIHRLLELCLFLRIPSLLLNTELYVGGMSSKPLHFRNHQANAVSKMCGYSWGQHPQNVCRFKILILYALTHGCIGDKVVKEFSEIAKHIYLPKFVDTRGLSSY